MKIERVWAIPNKWTGEKRGFVQKEVCLLYHGGAIHDTIVCVECFTCK